MKINQWSSDDPAYQRFHKTRVADGPFGEELSLDLRCTAADRPELLFSIALHEGDFFSVSGGMVNTGKQPVRVRTIHVMADAVVHEGVDMSRDFAMIDGFSGGEPLEYGPRSYSPLTRTNALKSRNNILLTFTAGDRRRLLVFAEDPVGKRVEPRRQLPARRPLLPRLRHPQPVRGAGTLRTLGPQRTADRARHVRLPHRLPVVRPPPGLRRRWRDNTSVGAVAEAKAIRESGFLNYSRAAVRLVPDTYARDTQQGWWDDERFRKLGSTNLGDFPGGQYQEPYETTRKWGRP
jgi:hypothetical protein